jgi:endonuclease G
VGAFAGGMAPNARIVAVRPTMQISPGDVLSIGYSVSHAAALTFIDHIAHLLDMPVTVNVSLGMNAGAHDGSTLLEAAFDGFSTGGRKAGRVIIKSAGNERGQNGHASLDLPSNSLEVLKWTSPQPHRGPDNIEVWFHSSDDVQFRLIGPTGGSPTAWVQFSTPMVSGALPSGETFAMTLDRYFRDNGDSRLLVTVNGPHRTQISAGTFSLEIQSGNIRSQGRLDAWIERTMFRPIKFANHVDDEVTLSVPGTARTVVAVASVGSNSPIVSSGFSSKGPCRDKREKPELSASGDSIAAADGGTAHGIRTESGTSMAAPHVTGAVALLFSRCRKLARPIPNAMQVSAALRGTTQNFNGRHTPSVGYGVLDAKALIDAF